MRYKTNRTHIMKNLYIIFAIQLALFTYIIGSVLRLLIHLLIANENETK